MGDPPVISVFGSSSITSDQPAYQEARQLGQILAEAGTTVATGGYGGVMEAVSEGASEGGGKVIGVTAPNLFPGRSGPNRFVQVEIPAHDAHERDRLLLELASATITLPGSIGTIVEFTQAWREAFLSPPALRKPHVAVGGRFKELAELIITEFGADPQVMICAPTASDAARIVLGRLGLEYPR